MANAKEIAAGMLGCDSDQLHYKFVEYLDDIEALVSNAGGTLLSRQLIAKAIVDWQLITNEKARGE